MSSGPFCHEGEYKSYKLEFVEGRGFRPAGRVPLARAKGTKARRGCAPVPHLRKVVVETCFCLEQAIYLAAPLYFLPLASRPALSESLKYCIELSLQVRRNQGAFQLQRNNL